MIVIKRERQWAIAGRVLIVPVTHLFTVCSFTIDGKEKPGKTTRPWGIPAPLLYREEGN